MKKYVLAFGVIAIVAIGLISFLRFPHKTMLLQMQQTPNGAQPVIPFIGHLGMQWQWIPVLLIGLFILYVFVRMLNSRRRFRNNRFSRF